MAGIIAESHLFFSHLQSKQSYSYFFVLIIMTPYLHCEKLILKAPMWQYWDNAGACSSCESIQHPVLPSEYSPPRKEMLSINIQAHAECPFPHPFQCTTLQTRMLHSHRYLSQQILNREPTPEGSRGRPGIFTEV